MPSEIFKQNLKSLQETNPLLALRFQLVPKKDKPLFQSPIPWERVPLETIDLLYLYGWEESIYGAFSHWLHQKLQRRLILLEDDLSVCRHFLEQESVQKMLKDSQVKLQFLEESPEETLKALVWSHPYAPSDFFALPTEDFAREKRAEKLYACLTDLQMGVELTIGHYRDYGIAQMRNVFANLLAAQKIKKGDELIGQFQGIPAIICGAGPSLARHIEMLKHLSDRALIFGGGSSLGPLGEQGITPHFGVVLDPDPPPERFLRQSGFHLPFFYQNQLSHTLCSQIHGEKFCLGEGGGFPLEQWLLEKLGLDLTPFEPGWNVATFAAHVAFSLGCNPIVFVGIDGCVLKDQVYIEGTQQPDEEQAYQRIDTIPCVDRFGNQAFSRPDFLMGKKWLEAFAASHSETHFINATEGGLSFDGIENLSLSEVIRQHLKIGRDLISQVHQASSQVNSYIVNYQDVKSKIGEIQASAEKCATLCSELLNLYEQDFLEESFTQYRYALQEFELDQEIFYQTLLLPVWEVWKHILQCEDIVAQMKSPQFEQQIQRALFLKEVSDHYLILIQEFS